jgi:hypothetical protein
MQSRLAAVRQARRRALGNSWSSIRQSPDIPGLIKGARLQLQMKQSSAAAQSVADRRSQHDKIIRETRCARRRLGRRIVVERGFARGVVPLPLARDCRRRPRRYSSCISRDRRSDVDELASAGAERLAALASSHLPTGVALPVPLRRCRSGRRKTCARSPVAAPPRIRRLSNPSFTWRTS